MCTLTDMTSHFSKMEASAPALKRQRTESVSLEVKELLLAIDTCERGKDTSLCATVAKLAAEAGAGTADSTLRTAVLIAFKRRNHEKSQSQGEGPGEKQFLLTVLKELVNQGREHLVLPLLPLLPMFGCWKDLRALAVQILAEKIAGAESSPVTLDPVCEKICELFASQMKSDLASTDGLPSSACKYTPHHKRHDKKKKSAAKEGAVAVEPSGRGGRGRGRGGRGRAGRGAAAGRPSRMPVAPEPEPEDILSQAAAHRINVALANVIADKLNGTSANQSAREAAFRRVRAQLNQRLTEKGALLETRLCSKQWNLIDFAKCPKGSLAKNKQALMKSEEGPRWKALMKTSRKAVPDLDNIAYAIACLVSESEFPGVLDSVSTPPTYKLADDKMLPLQIAKSVEVSDEQMKKLVKTAEVLFSNSETTLPPTTSGVAVSTAGCATRQDMAALVLAAYIATRAQGLTQFAVDGQLFTLSATPKGKPSKGCKSKEADEAALEQTCAELEWLLAVPMTPAPAEAADVLQRLEASCRSLLLPPGSEDKASGQDIICFCKTFAPGESLPTELEHMITSLQGAEVPLRTLRIHRLREPTASVDFTPRARARNVVTPGKLPTLDVCIVLDLTGSMGSYIGAVKTHLTSIIEGLVAEATVADVRVSLVGYRDYQDEGRVVTIGFKSRDHAADVVTAMQGQEARGGGDAPEDLLSAIVACNGLTWQSDVRVAVIVTDANAHGYSEAYEKDYYPTGRTPDQVSPYPSLHDAVTELAEKHKVDTLFCAVNNSTQPTIEAIRSRYSMGGFGVINMNEGVNAFREQILAGITVAVLGPMASTSIKGLQTADGTNVGSIMTSLKASLRETIRMTADKTKEEDPMDEEKDESAGVPLTDWQRLQADLELDELAPVRVALGMKVEDSLAIRSGIALLNAGLSVDMLLESGYPVQVVDQVKAAAAVAVKRL